MSEEIVTVEEIRRLLKNRPFIKGNVVLDYVEHSKRCDLWFDNFMPKLEAFLAQFTVPKDIEEILREKAFVIHELHAFDAQDILISDDKLVKLDDVLAVVGAQCVSKGALKKLHNDFKIMWLDEVALYPSGESKRAVVLRVVLKRLEKMLK